MQHWEKSDTSQIVVVHPHYRHPLRLLSRLMDSYSTLVLRAYPGQSASSLLSEIQQVQCKPEVIVLQDIDRLQGDEQRSLLHAMVQHLALIFVFARNLNRDWFYDPALVGHIRLHAEVDELGLSASYSAFHPRLDVFAFGRGEAYLDGQLLSDWGGVLQKMLFFYMVHHQFAPRSQILQALWPDFAPKPASNAFHVTKFRLHELLGFDLLVHRDNGYGLSTDVQIHYDVRQYDQLRRDVGLSLNEEKIIRMRKVLRIASHDFLTGFQCSWVAQTRQALERSRAEVMAELAHLLVNLGETDGAIGYAQRALTLYPQLPNLALDYLRWHEQAGRVEDAIPLLQNLLQHFAPASEAWELVRNAFERITEKL